MAKGLAVQLTPHFTLAELTHSEAATRLGIKNVPPPAVTEALRLVCVHVLEPVRAHFGRPVTVNSGYRSQAVNRAVKGSSTSQHVRGEAVDFEVPGVSNGDVAAWVRFNLQFDQLILEAYTPGNPSSGWVHCSWKPYGRRQSVLTFVPGKGYFNGLSV